MKNIIKTKMWVMSLLTLLLAYGCGDDAANNAIDNSVYFASVSNINTQRVTVDNITGASMPIQVRMAKESNTRTTVTVGVDENVLNSYNETNATGYAMLPADFYELSSNEAVVEVGSSLASSIILNVKPLSPELGKTGLTYAVPVAIQSVKGSNASVLSGSNYFIYLIVPTPIADVPVLSNGNGVRMKNQESPIVVTDYTVEFLIKVDGNGIAQGNNNQAIFNANNGTNDNDLIYTRFAADGGAGRYDKFSIKPHGGVEIETKYSFKNNTWYHIACVVDSKAGTCSIYVNGILDVKANVDSGKSLSLNSGHGSRSFRLVGQSDGERDIRTSMQTSEFRFWSVKRTEAQIKENMYGIAPNTPGLEVYWRCNEGSGKDIIDASGHGRDAVIGTATSTPKWNLNQSVEVGKQN